MCRARAFFALSGVPPPSLHLRPPPLVPACSSPQAPPPVLATLSGSAKRVVPLPPNPRDQLRIVRFRVGRARIFRFHCRALLLLNLLGRGFRSRFLFVSGRYFCQGLDAQGVGLRRHGAVRKFCSVLIERLQRATHGVLFERVAGFLQQGQLVRQGALGVRRWKGHDAGLTGRA